MSYPDIKVSFIIVNYNGGDFIEKCIKSIYENLAVLKDAIAQGNLDSSARGDKKESKGNNTDSSRINFEVIVVDNCSTDSSPEILQEIASQNPNFKLIENPENIGFSRASNIGAKNAVGGYLIFLNPDTKILNGSMEDLLRFHDLSSENIAAARNTGFDGNSVIKAEKGVTGVKVLNNDGSIQYSCRSFPTIARQFYESFFISRIFRNNRIFGSYFLSWWSHEEIREVDWLSGSFMLIKKTLFFKIGMFDEQYFMYSEDCDLCLKLKKSGFKNYYYPFFSIVHEDSGIASKRPVERELGIWKSRGIYYYKNYSKLNGLLFNTIYFFGVLNRIALFFLLSLFGLNKNSRKASRERFKIFKNVISAALKTAEKK